MTEQAIWILVMSFFICLNIKQNMEKSAILGGGIFCNNNVPFIICPKKDFQFSSMTDRNQILSSKVEKVIERDLILALYLSAGAFPNGG